MSITSLAYEGTSPAVMTTAPEPPAPDPAVDGPDPATAGPAMAAIADPARRWRLIHAQQRQSGLSVAAFCRRNGIGESSFFSWKRRFAADAQAGAAPRSCRSSIASCCARASMPRPCGSC